MPGLVSILCALELFGSLAVIYITLSAMYNSFTHPFVDIDIYINGFKEHTILDACVTLASVPGSDEGMCAVVLCMTSH